MSHGLAEKELSLIRGVFERCGTHGKVVLFGSRAKGTARPNSDVDLAILGDVADLECGRIEAALDELPLPYKFDVVCYDTIGNPALSEHIDRVGVTLFDASLSR